MDKQTDPVIIDLLNWLKENLPADTDEEVLFKKVRVVQKVFDTLIGLSFEEFYSKVASLHTSPGGDHVFSETSLEEVVNNRLDSTKEYLALHDELLLKTKKLNSARAKLQVRKEHHQLITSVRLDSCMDLISRYNRLLSKK